MNQIIRNGITYSSYYPLIKGTLTAGDTSLTITDSAITSSSTVDIYASVYGVSPSSVVVSDGSIDLTFDAQTEDMSVAVKLID